METAKIFKSGGSQAVRLPNSCQFDCDEVIAKRVGPVVMLYSKEDALKNFLECEPFTDDVHENILESRQKEYQSPKD
jgi:antitoxin VapB